MNFDHITRGCEEWDLKPLLSDILSWLIGKQAPNCFAIEVLVGIIKGSQLGAFCSYAIVYCYLEFKLRYHENLQLFSIRVKESFEPIILWKNVDGFLLFLKAFSWETDFWVTLGDFTVKNAKWGTEICI